MSRERERLGSSKAKYRFTATEKKEKAAWERKERQQQKKEQQEKRQAKIKAKYEGKQSTLFPAKSEAPKHKSVPVTSEVKYNPKAGKFAQQKN